MGAITKADAAVLDAIGEEQILAWRAEGWSWKRVCDAAGVGSGPLGRWLHTTDARWQAWQEAGEAGAAYKVGEIEEIADTAEPSSEGVAKARLQVDTKKWAVEHMDPATFRRGLPGGGVTINIAELHLVASREASQEARAERIRNVGVAQALGVPESRRPLPTDRRLGEPVQLETIAEEIPSIAEMLGEVDAMGQ